MKKIVIILCMIFTLSSFMFSQKGTTGWWIFRRPQSAKPKPVTTVAAVRGDLSGVLYNPSILATIQQREVFILTELGLAEDSFGGVLYGQPLKIAQRAGVCIGAVYYNTGKETLYYIQDGQEKSKDVTLQQDILSILSYGQRLTNNIFAGATFKFANSNIAETKSANAYACDIGVIFLAPIEGLVLSLAGQNLGSSTKFINRAEDLPMSVWCGTSYFRNIAKNSYLCVGFELPYIIKEKRTIPSVGVEYSIGQFAVNFGYRFGAEDALFHAGVGFSTAHFDLGYAFIPATYLSHTHRFTFGFRF